MSISQQIKDRIRAIDWCSNCGNVIDNQLDWNIGINYVQSWEEAEQKYTEISWEEKTLEARNELTGFLYNKHRNEYLKWNNITKEAKAFIEEEVLPKIKKVQEDNQLDNIFIDCIKWDILGALMEDAYKRCNKRPIFFLNLLDIYERGNFPCGWIENNEGEAIIIF